MPKEMREALVKLREQVEKNLEPVGEKFAEEARKIHYGESGGVPFYYVHMHGEGKWTATWAALATAAAWAMMPPTDQPAMWTGPGDPSAIM